MTFTKIGYRFSPVRFNVANGCALHVGQLKPGWNLELTPEAAADDSNS